MIDHDRRLIFIHISRTGGSSIETALVGIDWWSIDPETKHISAKMARDLYGENIWKTYTKFSVIRNPWDRIVSMWVTKWWHPASGLREDCTFDEFVRKVKPHPNEKYNTLHCHKILNDELDFILRFESLQEDFSLMLGNIGINDIVLPHIEKRERKHYKMMYNEKRKKVVSRRFRRDIKKFGYSY